MEAVFLDDAMAMAYGQLRHQTIVLCAAVGRHKGTSSWDLITVWQIYIEIDSYRAVYNRYGCSTRRSTPLLQEFVVWSRDMIWTLKKRIHSSMLFFILIFFHMFKISFKICMKQTLIGNITSIWNLCKMSSPNTINPFSDIFFSGLVNTNDQHWLNCIS